MDIRITSVLIIASAILIGSVFFMPQNSVSACSQAGRFFGFPAWYQYLPDLDSDCNVTPHRYNDGTLNIGATVGAVLLALIEILLRVAGIVAVGFVIYGGMMYTTSQGAPDKLQAARQTLINGLIGIFIAGLAVAIVNLVSNIIG